MNSKSQIPSPCISICAMNDDDVCMGCYRTDKEIREWMLMDDTEKQAVLAKLFERAKKYNPHGL